MTKSPKYSRNNHIMNLGIEILRLILCFWVITFHFAGNKNRRKYKILNTFYHVPTFMLISFYFSYKIFISKDIIKYKRRLERLLIPYIIWPLLFLLISFPFDSINIKQIIIDLLIQYISGYKIIGCLWFVQNLIFFGIFFQIIYFLLNKQSLIILQILFIISYLLQYEEINYKIFDKYPNHIRILSYIIEMMPIAIAGLILKNIDILKKISNDKIKYILFSIIALYFIYNYNIFGNIKGFYFVGIKQNIAGILLFIFFSLIPLNKINNKIILAIIKTTTRYTGGIYYLQKITDYILNKFEFLNQNPFLKCFMIYIFGFLICFLFTKIFRNNRLKYLFN